MSATLVLSQSVQDELSAIAAQPLETAGVLLCGVVRLGAGDIRLLARDFIPVPDGAYMERSVDSMSISSDGYVPALARAETLGATALWVHCHPGLGASPMASELDRVVDRELASTFRLRSGSDFYGALIVSPRADGLAFTGHVAADGGMRVTIDRMWLAGSRFRLTQADGTALPTILERFDRNVRAFGPAIQGTLGQLRIVIVGCGGTGSSVAEQLVRLGVRSFLLIDPDVLSDSNVTRVYGSAPADVGKAKVEVLADHLKRIAPDVKIEAVQSMVTVAATAKRLIPYDLVFGCTDDNAGRLVLSRVPTFLLTPLIDCGVLLSSQEDGTLTGIDGRVTVVAPEHACLLCRGRIDVARAAAEFMDPHERRKLQHEGYAPALGQVEPAVVAFTTLVAATAVSEMLERLIGYGPEPRPGEVLLRLHERETSTNIATPRAGHYCSESSSKLGSGVGDAFLDLAWVQ